jgi:tRNA threonylcarbamoyladenosine biosynthesis protein TsaB
MLPALETRTPGSPEPVVLAIDTTAGACSVAIDGGAGHAHRALPMTQGHSRHLLGLVESVLADLGIPRSRIDLIGFGCGPGSFTGLRIACGVAQGLGFGLDRPVVPVDAIRSLAFQAATTVPGADRIWVALDMRMGEVCHAVWPAPAAFLADPWAESPSGLALGPPAEALASFERSGALRPVLAGDAFDLHPGLAARVPDAAGRPSGAIQPDARAVARLALLGARLGRAVDASFAAPLYLRDKVALDVTEQAALRAARSASGASR